MIHHNILARVENVATRARALAQNIKIYDYFNICGDRLLKKVKLSNFDELPLAQLMFS